MCLVTFSNRRCYSIHPKINTKILSNYKMMLKLLRKFVRLFILIILSNCHKTRKTTIPRSSRLIFLKAIRDSFGFREARLGEKSRFCKFIFVNVHLSQRTTLVRPGLPLSSDKDSESSWELSLHVSRGNESVIV